MDSFQRLSSEHVVRNSWDYDANQWPMLFTDTMGMKKMLSFHICIAYDVSDISRFALLLTLPLESVVKCIKTQFRNTPGQVLIDGGPFAFTDELLNHLENMWYVDMKCPASRVTTKTTYETQVRG